MNDIKITTGKYNGKKIGDLNYLTLINCAKEFDVYTKGSAMDEMKEAIAGALNGTKQTPKPKGDTPEKGEEAVKTPEKAITKEAQAIVDATSKTRIHILNSNGPGKGFTIHRSEAVRLLTKLGYGKKQIGDMINMDEGHIYNVLWRDKRKREAKSEVRVN